MSMLLVTTLAVARNFRLYQESSHENINLATMSQGFAPVYTDAELNDIEKEVAP